MVASFCLERGLLALRAAVFLSRPEDATDSAEGGKWSLTAAAVSGFRAATNCPEDGLLTGEAAMSWPGAATNCPAKGLQTLGAAVSELGAATSCPAEGMGLRTIVAAVAGLGVATMCCRTLSNGEMADSQESGLPLMLEELLKLSMAESQEEVSHTGDSPNKV